MKTGIIGLGHIGKKHQQAIDLIEGVEVVAGVDQWNSEMLQGQPVYSELSDMISNHPDIEVVAVCTPNGLHKEHSLSVIEHGKHVICEKPMTTSKRDAEELINAALHSSRYIFCVMQNRFSPISQWLHDIVNSELLGEIYSVQLQCAWNRDERYYTSGSWHGSQDLDGGTLFTQFAHYVDSLYWLFGDLEITSARFENFNHKDMIDFEDTGMFDFSFGERALGHFFYTTSVWDKNMESSMSILAERGAIKVGGQYMNELSYCHIQDYTMPTLAPSNNIENLSKIYKNAKKVLRSGDKVMTNAMDGLKVVEIIENIYKFRKG